LRIIRFCYNKKISWGVLGAEDQVKVLKDAPFKRIIYNGQIIPFSNVRLLTPSVPEKIILVGLNYKDHARELGMKIPKEPIIFLKPPTALIAHKQKIVYPPGIKRLDYEAELALVVKKTARNISESKAKDYILGYTCLNDITARDIQKKDGQWSRAKSFDTFCPVGPWVETEISPKNLKVRAYLNGKLKQDSHTGDFIFGINRLFSFISKIMTLKSGDIISSGTPAGVGPMQRGDAVEIEIQGIGKLTNRVI